jgi:superfamily II DNA or RNA helicase
LFVEKTRWCQGKVRPSVPVMTTNLCKIKSRNKVLLKTIDILRKIDGKKILVLSGRIAHLTLLKEGMDELINKEVENDEAEQGEFKTAYYIGGMKDFQLQESAEADVIFATYSMAEEGLDIPDLNTLILATSKSNVVQSIGRIMRKQQPDGSNVPLIIDFVDNLSSFSYQGKKRKAVYIKFKYSIGFYKVFNSKVMSRLDYLKQLYGKEYKEKVKDMRILKEKSKTLKDILTEFNKYDSSLEKELPKEIDKNVAFVKDKDDDSNSEIDHDKLLAESDSDISDSESSDDDSSYSSSSDESVKLVKKKTKMTKKETTKKKKPEKKSNKEVTKKKSNKEVTKKKPIKKKTKKTKKDKKN